MSELGFFDPDETLPDDLESFLPLARPSGTIAADAQLGLFWEMYGTRPLDDELTLDVEIVRDGVSWLRRAGQRAGLVGPPTRVRLGWRESPQGGSIAARSLIVDLRELDPGRYRIEVRITPKGELPLVASRHIEITR